MLVFNIKPALGAAAAALMLGTASTANADVRFYAFDAGDRTTQSLTRGITLEVERGLFGATRLKALYSTTSRGSARFVSGGPSEVLQVLPQGARENQIYGFETEGDGPALGRALCPGASQTWLVGGRIRSGQGTALQTVGVWPDGKYRLCASLSYRYRGEWAQPPGPSVVNPDGLIQPR